MNKSFLKLFTVAFILMISSYIALFEVTNPHVTGFFNSEVYRPWHVNLEYAKFNRLKSLGERNIETLIVGSSTSEAFVAADAESLFKDGEAYVVSLGGADTPTRYSVIREALQRLKGLKRIIYVADFFEFNRALAKPEVAFQKEMSANIPDFAKPSAAGFFKYYLSNNSFEDSFNVLKRAKKGKRLKINSDGTMNQTMILSPLKTDSDPRGLLTKVQKAKLTEQILENTQTYKRSVLNNMEGLNPNVMSLYKGLIEETKERGVKLNFILSPYHHDFKTLLFTLPNISKYYQDWRHFLKTLTKANHVKVVDGTEIFIATEPMSGVWRDGIHYNRPSAFEFLKELVNKHSY